MLPKVVSTTIGSGQKGNIDTVKIMSKIARDRAENPIVRTLALEIIKNIPSHHHAEEALAIGQFVRDNVRYVRDPDGVELLTDPLTLIDQIKHGYAQGDCDDMSLLIASLLIATGHQPFFRCVRYQSLNGHYNHIYVVVYERDFSGPILRVVLDGIIKNKPIGTEINHRSGDEYRV